MEDAFDSRAFAPGENETEDSLVAEAAKTDAGAFGLLYERYYARVYRYVYHRVGNGPDAEDITALAFMKALEGLPSYRPTKNSFAPWLFRITRNSVVDHYRRGRSHASLEDVDHHAPDGDPVSHALNSERADEMRRLIQCLSPEQQDVILLRFAGDLSFPEIAATLSKQEPAVRMLLHRGLRKLKTVIDDG